ncbi:hypothetical protein ACFXTI_034966 [Malus domestica]
MNQETWPKSPIGKSKNKFSLLYSFTFSFYLNSFHVQPSWEVEFDALLLNTWGVAGPLVATTGSSISTAGSNALVRLQELLSLSTLQVLEYQGIDSVGACLNDLAANGQLSTEAFTRASSTLE